MNQAVKSTRAPMATDISRGDGGATCQQMWRVMAHDVTRAPAAVPVGLILMTVVTVHVPGTEVVSALNIGRLALIA